MGDSWFYFYVIKCFYYEKENGRKKRLNEVFSFKFWRGGCIKIVFQEGQGEISKDKGRNK